MHRDSSFSDLFSSLSERHRDQAVRVLAAGGIRGADGDEAPNPADVIAQRHELLSAEDARQRLSDDELGALWAELAELFASIRAGEVEGISRSDTDTLRVVSECLAACAVEAGARFTDAAAAADEIADLERAAGLVVDEEPSGDEAAEAAGGDEGEGGDGNEADDDGDAGEGEGEGGDAEAGAEAPAAGVQAGSAPARIPVPSLRQLNGRAPARRDVPAARVGGVNEDRYGGEANIRWLPTDEMVTAGKFHELMAAWPESRRGAIPVGQKVVLGRIDTLGAEAQRIDTRQDSVEVIGRKIEAATIGLTNPGNWDEHGRPREAILASGGWLTPSPVDYDLGPQIHTTARPVAGALASVGLDRGSLTWVRQPKLTDIVTGGPGVTTAAVGKWTTDDDESAVDGSPVKSHQRIGAPTTVTKELIALYRSLEVGVLQSRAYPEWVARYEALTEVAWARMSETFLLDQIEESDIIKFVSQATVIGATRDYLAFVISLAAQERHRQRMDPTASVRLLYPSWLVELCIIDLLRSGTNFVDSSPQVVARNFIESTLRAGNVNGTAYLDSSTDGGQLLSAQADDDDLNELPTRTRSYLFHEGAYVHADGGTLDLGVVRDADLVETNDYRIFAESFENVLDRGEWAYCLDAYLCPSGTSSAAVDIQHLCTTGS
jgi:hypothetical protein